MSRMTTNLTLLEKLKNPADIDAWQRYYQKYGPLIRQWSKRYPLDEAETEDVAQTIAFVVFQKLKSGEFVHDAAKGKFRGWLRTIMSNEVVNRLRKRKSRPGDRGRGGTDAKDLLGEESDYRLPDDAPLELEEVARQQEAALEMAEVAVRVRVNPNTWMAYQMLKAGHTAEMVKKELGMTIAAVYRAKHRIITLLNEEIRGQL